MSQDKAIKAVYLVEKPQSHLRLFAEFVMIPPLAELRSFILGNIRAPAQAY